MPVIRDRLGDLDAARDATGRALTALNSIDDLDTRLSVLNSAWVSTFEAGDVGNSLQLAARGLEVARELGDRHCEAQLLSNLGLNHAALGRHEEARAVLDESVRLGRRLGSRRNVGYGLQNLALVHLHLELLADAERQARESAETFEESDAFGSAGAELYLGMVLERARRIEEAAGCFAAARRKFQAIGTPGLAVEASAGLARCALASGDPAAATALADTVWEHLGRQGRTGLDSIALVYLTCFDVFTATGDTVRARQVATVARADLADRADRITDPDARRAFLHDLPHHRRVAGLAPVG